MQTRKTPDTQTRKKFAERGKPRMNSANNVALPDILTLVNIWDLGSMELNMLSFVFIQYRVCPMVVCNYLDGKVVGHNKLFPEMHKKVSIETYK